MDSLELDTTKSLLHYDERSGLIRLLEFEVSGEFMDKFNSAREVVNRSEAQWGLSKTLALCNIGGPAFFYLSGIMEKAANVDTLGGVVIYTLSALSVLSGLIVAYEHVKDLLKRPNYSAFLEDIQLNLDFGIEFDERNLLLRHNI